MNGFNKLNEIDLGMSVNTKSTKEIILTIRIAKILIIPNEHERIKELDSLKTNYDSILIDRVINNLEKAKNADIENLKILEVRLGEELKERLKNHLKDPKQEHSQISIDLITLMSAPEYNAELLPKTTNKESNHGNKAGSFVEMLQRRKEDPNLEPTGFYNALPKKH